MPLSSLRQVIKFLSALLLVTTASCSTHSAHWRNPQMPTFVHPTSGGIVIDLPTGRLRLDPYGDSIIRVRFSKTGHFSSDPSLIVSEPPTKKQKWILQTNHELDLATATLIARVDLTTGNVIFTDTKGRLLLCEQD